MAHDGLGSKRFTETTNLEGSREPGTEALDVYSELKNIMLNFDPSRTEIL